MFVKFIVCRVSAVSKEAFSCAQEQWTPLQDSDGFYGQIGGWSLHDEDEACILSFWEDETSYKNFTDSMHDVIYLNNKQQETYNKINIKLFERVFKIKGEDEQVSVLLKEGKIIRLSLNLVREGMKNEFLKVQEEIWNPGMANSPGMLYGVFAERTNDDREFVVVSFWENLEAHQEYAHQKVKQLRDRSNISRILEESTGKLVHVVGAWSVFPREGTE